MTNFSALREHRTARGIAYILLIISTTAGPVLADEAGQSSWQFSGNSQSGTSTVWNGAKTMNSMSSASMSSSSSSSTKLLPDGGRVERHDVTAGSTAWRVNVAAVDQFAAGSTNPTRSFGVLVDDSLGRHEVTPSQTYTGPDGSVFMLKDNGVHIERHGPDSRRQVTDIDRHILANGSSQLSVQQHSCQGDHC